MFLQKMYAKLKKLERQSFTPVDKNFSDIELAVMF